MFNRFIAFHMAGVNFLCHQFTIFNSFHYTPWQHFFGPFSGGAWSDPHRTNYMPRRAFSQWPRHAWLPPGPDSHRSLDDCFEGSDGWNLLRVMVKAIMLRKLSPDLEHVLQLAPPQNNIDHLVLGEGAGPSHIWNNLHVLNHYHNHYMTTI